MKLINLLPETIISERQQNRFKKYVLGLLLVPVGLYLKLTFTISGIEADIAEANSKLTDANALEQQIKLQEQSLFNDIRIVNVLSKDNFPLHRYLLFMSVDMPEDMRLFSVTSESFIQQQVDEEKAKEAAEKEKENGGATQTLEQITEEETTQADKEAAEKEEEQKIQQLYAQQKTLYVRGSAISVESVGKFMQELEANDFIEKVSIKQIQNYYNGAHSYKIFELIVTTK